MDLVVDQDEAAGDPEDGLFGAGVLRVLPVLRVAAGDAAYRALKLILGDLDDLRGDAGRVREGEDGGLVTDEENRAGAFLFGVAGGAAGGAVVTAWGVVADEQPVGFGIADLGAYVLADVEHARHGWLLELGACAGRFPAHEEDNGRSVAGVTRERERNRTNRSRG